MIDPRPIILLDLDNDRQTTVYDQAALNAAADRITICMQNLEGTVSLLHFAPDQFQCHSLP